MVIQRVRLHFTVSSQPSEKESGARRRESSNTLCKNENQHCGVGAALPFPTVFKFLKFQCTQSAEHEGTGIAFTTFYLYFPVRYRYLFTFFSFILLLYNQQQQQDWKSGQFLGQSEPKPPNKEGGSATLQTSTGYIRQLIFCLTCHCLSVKVYRYQLDSCLLLSDWRENAPFLHL